jgi:hypothetical protein
MPDPQPQVSQEERYAEGQREPSRCRHCGQPIWIVYHGPRANHTVESFFGALSDEEQRMYEEARKSIVEARYG